MTRTCTKCEKELPIESFDKAKTKKSGYQSRCKPCRKEVQDKWYKKNAADHYEKTNAYRNKVKQQMLEYLGDKSCMDCSESDPVVLEFDHRDITTKQAEISVLMSKGFSWENILQEIEKCDIRCCNCHRKKTAKQFGYYRYK